MRILVVGGGGREHALCHVLARAGHEVIAAPGNPGIAAIVETTPIGAGDLPGLVALASARAVELVVVGPEAPLVAGLGDRLRAAGIPCFGPDADGARLEGSKAWSKQFFARHGVPTAAFAVVKTEAEVDAALARLGTDVVVKADGLAAGKGVVVGGDVRAAALAMLAGSLGEAGLTVVIEERITGRELSIFALTDGERSVVLPGAEDHKAVFDGDRGPNTGGMGAVSPAPSFDPALLPRIEREVLAPTLAGLKAERIAYRGVLFAGLMVRPDGSLSVLEYNCRFGDPETEVILPRLEGDLGAWLFGAAVGALPAGSIAASPRPVVGVVMASAGYPATPTVGDPIRGVDAANALPGVVVFHAGTRHDTGGELVTAGGRVLCVTASGEDLAEARRRAYQAVETIGFAGAHFRRDIGARTG
jgi:phosphoribosylamine---glycine ligase